MTCGRQKIILLLLFHLNTPKPVDKWIAELWSVEEFYIWGCIVLQGVCSNNHIFLLNSKYLQNLKINSCDLDELDEISSPGIYLFIY